MGLKDLTQGGQVTLHNIRMFRQVFTMTLVLTLICGLLFWGVKTWYGFTSYQCYLIWLSLAGRYDLIHFRQQRPGNPGILV